MLTISSFINRVFTLRATTKLFSLKITGLILSGLFFFSTARLHGQCQIIFSQCPMDTTYLDCKGQGEYNMTAYPPVSAYLTGNCQGYTFSLVQVSGPTLPAQLPYGTYLIQFIAFQNFNGQLTGEDKSCSFHVSTAKDNQPPVFTYCPPSITVNGVLDVNGNCTATGLWPLPIVSDNCDYEMSSNLQSNIPCGSPLGAGEHTITYTATDEAGNTAVCNFSVTVKCPSGTGGPGAMPYALRVFPNPNAGTFTVELPQPATSGMRFRLTDLAGRLVQETIPEAGKTQQQVNTGSLPNGLYFLQVISAGKVLAIEKVVKQ